MSDRKIQWHPGFAAAMHLELNKYKDNLIFEKEYNLNTKPLEIDLLIIKKETDAPISNEIGIFFKGHNILEYKSPEDHLNIDSFFKTTAYACLYKSYSATVDGIRADDITLSIVREAKPEGIFKYFREHNCQITNTYQGIYYIKGPFPFPAQIIVTRELDPKEHTWLRALSGKLDEKDIENLLANTNRLTGKAEREMADSVLEVSVKANKQIIKKLMGDENMCNALMEIMEPKIKELMEPKMEEIRKESQLEGLREGRREGLKEGRREGLKEGRKEGRKEGLKEGLKEGRIQGIIEALRDLKHSDSEIKSILIKQYSLTEEELNNFL